HSFFLFPSSVRFFGYRFIRVRQGLQKFLEFWITKPRKKKMETVLFTINPESEKEMAQKRREKYNATIKQPLKTPKNGEKKEKKKDRKKKDEGNRLPAFLPVNYPMQRAPTICPTCHQLVLQPYNPVDLRMDKPQPTKKQKKAKDKESEEEEETPKKKKRTRK